MLAPDSYSISRPSFINSQAAELKQSDPLTVALVAPIVVPAHVLTYDYFADRFPNATLAQMAPWLSWADVTMPELKAVSSYGIETILYTDPNCQKPGGWQYSTDENVRPHVRWLAHHWQQ